MFKSHFILALILALLFTFSCTTDQEDSTIAEQEEISEVRTEEVTLTFIFKGESYSTSFSRSENGDLNPLQDGDFVALKGIYDSNPTLVEVFGLDGNSNVYLFSGHKSYVNFLRATGRCATQRLACGGGGGSGGSGGGGSSSSLYTASNFEIFIDSYLQKKLDWTSNCYSSSNTVANENRLKNLNKNDTNYWTFSNSSVSCFPAGINNPNDKPSSFRSSPAVASVTIYEHKNYGGKSKIFYRAQAGTTGNVQWYIDNSGWMVVSRLKDWNLGFLDTWDDDVSSFRLN